MSSNTRAIWNGAISFGLVNIPVALYSAANESGLDFEWLDKRTRDPVGYKRINKRTGQEIGKENIVKGISYNGEQYVVLTDDEVRHALAKNTQTIEIESFVSANEIPLLYFERPYYLAPADRGAKSYGLLREALLKTQRVGIARVVIHTKQHLAVLMPYGPMLVLILLRWAAQIRSWKELKLPPEGMASAGLTERELSMAIQLVDSMSEPWEPEKFQDSFTAKVMELVEKKVKAGQTATIIQSEDEIKISTTADIIDLTELLQRSLRRGTDKRTRKISAKNDPMNTMSDSGLLKISKNKQKKG
ncbi:MAG: Ku protein [Firmicutes bacterium]|nr:Ku protein [Bacillota bacterium]